MSVMQAKEFVLLNRELALLNIKILQELDMVSDEMAYAQFLEMSKKCEEFLDKLIIDLENNV